MCEEAACCLAGIRVEKKIGFFWGGQGACFRAAESAQCVPVEVLIDELLVAIPCSYSPNSGELAL